MIKDFLDDVMDWMMDYFMPVLMIAGFTMFGIFFIEIIFGSSESTLEQTVETCIIEQREEEPECKFAILKYTRKQNHTTVTPVPAIITHK